MSFTDQRCPRCHGTLVLVAEIEGLETSCLSCGHRPRQQTITLRQPDGNRGPRFRKWRQIA